MEHENAESVDAIRFPIENLETVSRIFSAW